MNETIFIAQNEIINLCQGFHQNLGLSYKEIIFALGFAEGRIAQMDYTQATYDKVQEAQRKEQANETKNATTEADKE